MLLTVTRTSSNGKSASVWEFQFYPGAIELEQFRLELISYTKYKKVKDPAEWRSVGRWALGWNCTLPWTAIRLPRDVYDEVRNRVAEKLNYMIIRAGNHPLPIEYLISPSSEAAENEMD